MSYYIFNKNFYPPTIALTSNYKYIDPYNDIYLLNYRKKVLDKIDLKKNKKNKNDENAENDEKINENDQAKKKKEKNKKDFENILDTMECPTC